MIKNHVFVPKVVSPAAKKVTIDSLVYINLVLMALIDENRMSIIRGKSSLFHRQFGITIAN